MGIFGNKLLGVAELQKRIDAFDEETATLEAEMQKASRRVSVALARGNAADKLLQEAASLRVQLDSRPLAKQALQRELRRAERAAAISQAKGEVEKAKTWATRMAKTGSKISVALEALGAALVEWRQGVADAGSTGPQFDRRVVWGAGLKLEPLADILGDVIKGLKQSTEAVQAVQRIVDNIERQAADGPSQQLDRIAAQESSDPEVLDPEPELEPAKA